MRVEPPRLSVGLPRKITPNIDWLGDCLQVEYQGGLIHGHSSIYLVRGSERSLLVDTGHPAHWARIEADLDDLLGGEQLDWILPTHAELPHSGNLHRLGRKYPAAKVVGDVRDYHLFFPRLAERLQPWPKREPLKLGGGTEIVLVEAPLKDLVSTQWAFETSERVLFVADGFGYMHARPGGAEDQPVHRPGECSLFSTEWQEPPGVEHAAFLTRAALAWTRYVDDTRIFEQVAELLDAYPPRLVAPAHGSVISDFEVFLPKVKEAHRLAFGGAMSDSVPTPVVA
jgi:hypothetical protein